MLSKTLQYWTGPMSIAIYVKRSELDALVKTIYTDLPLFLGRKNIDIHFVLQSGVSIHGENVKILALLEHPKKHGAFHMLRYYLPKHFLNFLPSCVHYN